MAAFNSFSEYVSARLMILFMLPEVAAPALAESLEVSTS
jgi:hypothetical protein